MAKNKTDITDSHFIALFEGTDSIAQLATELGITERVIYRRRRRIEQDYGIKVTTKMRRGSQKIWPEYQNVDFKQKKPFDIVIVSDKHNDPGVKPPAFYVACEVIEDVKPKVLVVNGDWFDLSNMSRHAQRGWEDRPKVTDEIEDGVADLKSLKAASPKSKLFFTLGNHDMRFDGKIAELIPDLEGIEGASLIDHIEKDWTLSISITVNDCLLIKHRFRSGIHAAWNNVLHTGVSVATGHTHRCLVRPFTDFNGTRYAMETGCIADINSPVFAYAENNPKDWQPGLMVIHMDGSVVSPEPIRLIQQNDHPKNNKALFRGKWYG